MYLCMLSLTTGDSSCDPGCLSQFPEACPVAPKVADFDGWGLAFIARLDTDGPLMVCFARCIGNSRIHWRL